MARRPRVAPGGYAYHVLNRSAGHSHLFRRDGDFEAFVRVIVEAHQREPIPILSYCILSNHWHFVVLPERDGQLSSFFRWLTHTHAMRWRVSHNTVGYGPLYQGRFKSFPIQRDDHLLTVCRYVERNAMSAGIVRRAEDWRWCSLWARQPREAESPLNSILCEWPVDRPADWVKRVNQPITAKENDRLQQSIARGRPFGSDRWTAKTISELGLDHTIRSEGRPKTASVKNADPEKRGRS